MDIIFFNKNPDYYIGEAGGVAALIDAQEYTIQVNLKSRILSNEIQDSLMRCKNCKTICAKEFILAKDENFFEEFNYLNNSNYFKPAGKYKLLFIMPSVIQTLDR